MLVRVRRSLHHAPCIARGADARPWQEPPASPLTPRGQIPSMLYENCANTQAPSPPATPVLPAIYLPQQTATIWRQRLSCNPHHPTTDPPLVAASLRTCSQKRSGYKDETSKKPVSVTKANDPKVATVALLSSHPMPKPQMQLSRCFPSPTLGSAWIGGQIPGLVPALS